MSFQKFNTEIITISTGSGDTAISGFDPESVKFKIGNPEIKGTMGAPGQMYFGINRKDAIPGISFTCYTADDMIAITTQIAALPQGELTIKMQDGKGSKVALLGACLSSGNIEASTGSDGNLTLEFIGSSILTQGA